GLALQPSRLANRGEARQHGRALRAGAGVGPAALARVDLGVATMSVHPRVAVNSISSLNLSLEQDLALVAELGVDRVGIISPKLDVAGWETGRQAVVDAKVLVTSMSCYPYQIPESVEFTAAVKGQVLYVVSGGAGTTPWEKAAERYCEGMAPLVARAKEVG